jgi:nitronate monooxygenase
MSLPEAIADRLRLPLIAAPMLRVSGPELVSAACAAGVIGGFPTANARTPAELDEWLTQIEQATGAPYAANLIVRSPRFAQDLQVLVNHGVELVITSVGSPKAAVGPLHEVGALVFADVATLHHAKRAVEAGADGLILLAAGAGGQTGWLNPFAFVRAVRAFFDGPLVLAGGVSDGHALHAARVLGCDLAYMGTAFLATRESRAEPAYKQMIVDASLDDIVLTRAFTGLPTSMLAPSIHAAGLDPAQLDETVTPAAAAELYGRDGAGPHRWSQVWSAGHSVSGVRALVSVAELVEQTEKDYADAREATR